MLTRCWLPPESRATSSPRRSSSPVSSSISRDRRLGVVVALEAGEEAQVLLHREPPVERRLLRHPADLAAGEADLALVAADDPGEDREQGRLAGAVGADHRQQLARLRPEVDRRAGPRARRSA